MDASENPGKDDAESDQKQNLDMNDNVNSCMRLFFIFYRIIRQSSRYRYIVPVVQL